MTSSYDDNFTNAKREDLYNAFVWATNNCPLQDSNPQYIGAAVRYSEATSSTAGSTVQSTIKKITNTIYSYNLYTPFVQKYY